MTVSTWIVTSETAPDFPLPVPVPVDLTAALAVAADRAAAAAAAAADAEATAASIAAPAWSAVTGKPTAYPPASHVHEISEVSGLGASLADFVSAGSVGAPHGVAPLDEAGRVPSAHLPSYVDSVTEAASVAAFPAVGEGGKIYVAVDTGKTYRWGGSVYVEISASPGSTDAVTEGTTNLYHTGARVLSVLLAGLSTATNAVIVAGDTVLAALGKLQAQISGLTAALAGKVSQGGNLGTGATVPTPSAADDSQKVANTAWIRAYMSAVSSGVVSVNGRSGTVTLTMSDITGALGYTPFSATGGTISGVVTLGANYPYVRWGANDATWRMEKDSAEGTLGKMHLRGSTDGFASSWLNAMTWDATNQSFGIGTDDPYAEDGAGASFVVKKSFAGSILDLIYNTATGASAAAGRLYKTGSTGSWMRQRLFDANLVFGEVGAGVVNGWAWRGPKFTFEGPDGTDLLYFDQMSASIGVPLSFEGSRLLNEVSTGIWYAILHGVSPANSAAANKMALDALIAAAIAAGGGTIRLPRGKTNCSPLATITGAVNVVIEGLGKFVGGSELCFDGDGNCITFSGGAHSGIRNTWITSSTRRTAGWAVIFADGAWHPICDVRIDYHWNGVWVHGGDEIDGMVLLRYLHGTEGVRIDGTSTDPVNGANLLVQADNPYPISNGGLVVEFASGGAVTTGQILHCPTSGIVYQVTNSGTLGTTEPSTVGGTGPSDAFSTAITSGTAGLKFVCRHLSWVVVDSWAVSVRFRQGSHVLDGYRGLFLIDTAATTGSRPEWVYIDHLETDHTFWHGVEAYRGKSLYGTGPWLGSSLTGRGLMVDSGFGGDVALGPETRIYGNWLEGAYFGACSNVRLVAGTVEENSQKASGAHANVVFDGTTHFAASGLRTTGARTSYGIQITATADHFAVVGNIIAGNVTGAISNGAGTSAGRREVANNISI